MARDEAGKCKRSTWRRSSAPRPGRRCEALHGDAVLRATRRQAPARRSAGTVGAHRAGRLRTGPSLAEAVPVLRNCDKLTRKYLADSDSDHLVS